MIPRKNIIAAAALALAWAGPLFAGTVSYQAAAAPWSAEQALKLPTELTAAFLKTVEKDFGPAASDGLSEKKEKVAALVKRFKSCALNAEDQRTAERYFTADFKAEVRYFAGAGCAVFRESAEGRPDSARSVSLNELEGFSASGVLSTSEGSARFFDGAGSKSAAVITAAAAGGQYRPAAGAAAALPFSKTLSSAVPALRAETGKSKVERPADLGMDGPVNQALVYWSDLRKRNWEAYKKEGLTGTEKAKALMKAAAGAGFGGLLTLSNLPNVEIAGARLRWDIGQGAGAGVITADAVRLVFHSGVFVMALAPIPVLKVAQAAIAGEGWAIALIGAMAAGPVNRYVLHFL